MASGIFKGLAGIMQGKISKELIKKYKDEGMDLIDAITKGNEEANRIVTGRKLDFLKTKFDDTNILTDDYVKLIDEEILNGSKKGKKVFNRSLRGVGLSDLLIIHNWLNYAKLIKDESYKDITNEIFFSEYIFQAVKRRDNQN